MIWHDALKRVAKYHGDDMLARRYLSLVSPDGYDIFQLLVSVKPSITFDESYAVVYQVPTGTGAAGTFAALMSVPGAAAALMDPTMTQVALDGAQGSIVEYHTVILGRNVVP